MASFDDGYSSPDEDSNPNSASWSSSDEADPREFIVPVRRDDEEIRKFADILACLHEPRVQPQPKPAMPASVSPSTSPVVAAAGVRGETASAVVKTADSIQKKKRRRTSPEQLRVLESFFETNKMPSQATRVKLAEKLGMSSRRVQIWFQNKRAKLKRTSKDGSGGGSDDGGGPVLAFPGSPTNEQMSRFSAFRFNHGPAQQPTQLPTPFGPGMAYPSMIPARVCASPRGLVPPPLFEARAPHV